MSVAISRTSSRVMLVFQKDRSLAHLLEQHVSRFNVPVKHANCVEVVNTHYDLPAQPETLGNRKFELVEEIASSQATFAQLNRQEDVLVGCHHRVELKHVDALDFQRLRRAKRSAFLMKDERNE